MDEFAVYVLYSESADRLYIGYSSNSIERFRWHNGLSSKGFTVRHRPWKMIHIEVFDSKQEAMKRELQLKGGAGQAWIRAEILPPLQDVGFLST